MTVSRNIGSKHMKSLKELRADHQLLCHVGNVSSAAISRRCHISTVLLHTTPTIFPPVGYPIQDDVLGVVNHLDHMVTLLLLELRTSGRASPNSENRQSSPCLEYLLSENLLDTLFAWSIHTGRYGNAVRLEQLKLYELLVSHSRHQLLVHEPFLRPLLKLLASCAGEVFPVEVEKRLVVLLNQLCVSLMQNIELLDLFFYASPDQGPAKFVIFTLLIPFVHREGGIGQQARDALLLCMSLSKKNENVGSYIAEHSNVCPVLATGLSGLYSLLPRKLVIETEDWHRLTPDDVNEISELTMFMNSLEFCNAVVQVAHPVVKKQMLEFLYQGFLVPVMGPALLQDSLGLSIDRLDSPQEASTVEELVAATAYFDLFLRSITEPGLLYSFVRFLLEDKYDGERILDSLIQRLNSKSRLCLVTLALFETLVDLNCEDVMLELVLKYLVPCTHVMLSQRRRVRDMEPYCRSSDKFLSLSPACCNLASRPAPTPSPSLPAMLTTTTTQHRRSMSFTDSNSLPSTATLYGLRSGESLYGNYHAYLCDARKKIRECAAACVNWAYPYDGEKPPHSGIPVTKENCDVNQSQFTRISVNSKEAEEKQKDKSMESETKLQKAEELGSETIEQTKVDSICVTEEGKSETCNSVDSGSQSDVANTTSNYHSLPSIGESSGYESFALKGSSESTPENERSEGRRVDLDLEAGEVPESRNASRESSAEDSGNSNRYLPRHRHGSSSSSYSRSDDISTPKSEIWPFSRKFSREGSYLDIFNTTPDIGPFLDVILRKLEAMMSNSLYVNLHLTGLISRLAVYPQPLLHSFLLNHSLVFQPSIRSLFQVLGSLKQKMDQYLTRQRNVEELVAQAQDFLVGREDRLVNARRHVLEALNPHNNNSTGSSANNSRRNSVSNEPFSRGEPKRRSFSSTLSSVFRRTQPQTIRESQSETSGTAPRNYRSLNNHSLMMSETAELRNIVMCAVLLDEWLKELAAVTQEQAVSAIDVKMQDVW